MQNTASENRNTEKRPAPLPERAAEPNLSQGKDSAHKGGPERQENMELIDLRYRIAMERIGEIPGENAVDPQFTEYFGQGARWLLQMQEHERFLSSGEALTCSLQELREKNRQLYEKILPGAYEHSFANPQYAVRRLGSAFGAVLSSLIYEIRSVIPFVYRGERERFLIRVELFLEVYTSFTVAFAESGGCPAPEYIRKIMRQYLADYCEDEMVYYLRDKLVEGYGGIIRSISDDRHTVRDLYLTGEYVTSDELTAYAYIDSLESEQIEVIASAITEGFRRGFINGGKNLAAKKNAAVIFHLGFERIARQCIRNLAAMGLKAIVSSEVPTLFHKYRNSDMGYGGANPNPQYYYDHSEDQALYLDASHQKRRIEGLTNAYRELREQTLLYAGPVVMETFGSKPFVPVSRREAPAYDSIQRTMCTEYEIKADVLYSDAVAAHNRSYTVIAFPLPSIAGSRDEYEKIFEEVISINTLDYALYEKVQGKMIDVLSRSSRVEVKGMNGNRTDLRIRLAEVSDPENEANFENCTADLNIPVGEVFTTPVLEGTNGKLHVTGVHLEGFYFKDLEIDFRDGRVCGYSCENFEDRKECIKYIEDNILSHHKDLPMGECAIGTNTTAYAAASRFGIAGRLPILIAEKTGPHFAVGDTCYAHDEDNRVYNPDGKEIIAKDNSVSIKRRSDPAKAYFGCHTDITIPYEELGEFTAVHKDGTRTPILLNGRFVLEGTQILNKPLDSLAER